MARPLSYVSKPLQLLFARMKLSLTQKVMLGLLLLVLCLLMGSVTNMLASAQVRHQVATMTDKTTPLVLNANALAQVLLNADRQLKTVPGLQDEHLTITTINNFAELQQHFAEALARLKQTAGDSEELQSLISPLDSLDEDYFAQGKALGQQHLAQLTARAQLDELRHQWREAAVTTAAQGIDIGHWQSAMLQLLEAEDDFALSRATDAVEQAQGDTATHPQAAALAALLSKMLQTQQQYIAATTELASLTELTGGSIDYATAVLGTVDQVAHDRVGQGADKIHRSLDLGFWLSIGLLGGSLVLALLVSINIYRSIKRPLSELLAVQRAAVDGDVTRNVAYQSHNEFGLLADSTNQLLAHIRQLLTQLNHGAAQLAQVATENRRQAGNAHRSLEQQRQQTMQVTVAMGQMGSAVQEVAQAAAASLESVLTMEQAVHVGREQVRETITGSRKLAAQLQQAAVSLQSVDHSSQQIGGVLDVIRGVAEQTNLLALNAAIEAARAGDHGRGFAVVATEVRTLAQQTAESANTIKSIIEQLQLGAQSTVKLMQQCQQQMDTDLQQSAKAEACMDDIRQLIVTVSRNSEQIASAATEQQSTTEHIAENLQQIAAITEDNYQGISGFVSASQHLEQLVQAQGEQVQQFRY
ncbi:methyl-accepting chemotaxis protein [Shewanella sp. 4t3-1-2LB]|uniref:methyl-accepting chemotaxis protein n=1 Tax=Shewanella sp. 4t3-1-2LB TaxID=2817682 RepID=UPI001A9832CB|nr:methyl-accepting chemotaxis protein [Shewanella sp. 4t3-1-2LB]MBO1271291.1 methyl-accepting chemotaxis protein [Shewanella sp. 4t3-1-2LB]